MLKTQTVIARVEAAGFVEETESTPSQQRRTQWRLGDAVIYFTPTLYLVMRTPSTTTTILLDALTERALDSMLDVARFLREKVDHSETQGKGARC